MHKKWGHCACLGENDHLLTSESDEGLGLNCLQPLFFPIERLKGRGTGSAEREVFLYLFAPHHLRLPLQFCRDCFPAFNDGRKVREDGGL